MNTENGKKHKMKSLLNRVNELLGTKYDNLYWDIISSDHMLTRDFMEEFKEYLNWDIISEYQYLSKDDILKFKDYLNFDILKEIYGITP